MDIPSMPSLPPKITEEVIKENFCVIHKGPIIGELYQCKCGAQMCRSCAIQRKTQKNRLCPICSSAILLKKQ